MIHDPFSDESFWFEEPEWESDPLDAWESHDLDPARDQWGWDEWGDVCVFRPFGYEPGYRYPLVVWLCLDEEPGQTLRDWFPDVSDRNYIGAGIPIHREDGLARNAEKVAETIRELSAIYGIHPERIWLAGLGPAADWTLWLFPVLSNLFTGLVAIGPCILEPVEQPALQAAVGKQLFLVTPDDNAAELSTSFAEIWEMCCGDCDAYTVDSLPDRRLDICRELNLWLMRQVCPVART